MLINYLKSAIRNFLRNKGFAILNITSLTIGIIGCLAIGLFVWDELQFDNFVPGGENVYRIYEERIDVNATTYTASVPPAFSGFLIQNYPEVETTARILMLGDRYLFEYDDNSNYEDKGYFAEGSFFDIFPLNFVVGNRETVLDDPYTVVISKDMASRYFGNSDPVGKTVKIDKEEYRVTGVFEKYTGNFHRDFNYLMSLSSAGLAPERMNLWTWHQFWIYVRLKPGTDIKSIQDKFQAYVRKEIHPEELSSKFLPWFQALKDIHLKSSKFQNDVVIRGNETYVKALSIIVLFVLAIACFNFINLSTARSFKRAREIGIRKVVGAYKNQLVTQFIGESVVLSVISMIIAVMVTLAVVPWLNEFTGKSIDFNPFKSPVGSVLLFAGIIIGIFAGIYPSLVLSEFKPVKVLKNLKAHDKDLSTALLRKSLIVLQFVLSILLVICTVIVYRQTKFFNEKDLGFSKEQIVQFEARGKIAENPEIFISELKRSPNVVSATSGYGLPGDAYAGENVIIPGDIDKEHPANVFIGDYDYVKTLELRIIAGRDFSKEMSTDVNEAFLINETAVREFGFGSPQEAIGQRLNWNEWEPDDPSRPVKQGKVIGVVQDFHYKSLHEKITPSVIQLYPKVLYKIAVKLQTDDITSTLGYIEEVWNSFAPEYPFDYEFMDVSFGKMYMNEEKLGTLLLIFAAMAIVVGCLGLLALAALSAEERTKEIGIRKAVGAKAVQIMALLSGNFLLLIIIAAVIAIPIAWLTMSDWLQNFSYRITIEWWIFLLSVMLTLLIAFVTISFQTIRVSMMKPVRALRTE